MVKCDICGKTFKTKQGLEDHIRAVHAKPKARPQKKKPAPQRRGASEMGVFRFPGRDQLVAIDKSANEAPVTGEVVLRQRFTTDVGERLRVVSSAFRRWRLLKLEYHITSHTSKNAGGGYVAAFCVDPPPQGVTAAELGSVPRSVSRSWHENGVVRITGISKKFETGDTGSFHEDFGPGEFVMIVTGKADQRLNFVVDVEYTVELSEAGMVRKEAPVTELHLRQEMLPVPSTNHTKQLCNDLFGLPLPDQRTCYTLPFPVGIWTADGTGNTATTSVFYLWVQRGHHAQWSVDSRCNSSPIWKGNDDPVVLLPIGITLKATPLA